MSGKMQWTVVAFSLCACFTLCAESESDLSADKTSSSSQCSQDMPGTPVDQKGQGTPSKQEEASQALPKKIKPHFAGARRSPDIKKTPDPSKPKRVKNPWFSSKTQPKVEKKEAPYEAVTELPKDHPHFVKTSKQITFGDVEKTPSSDKITVNRSSLYPKTGVEAPRGHVFFSAEWLLWRMREEGFEFVTSHLLEFNYASGFRVGLGVHLPYTDGWDINANYTDFRPEASKSQTGHFYPLFLFQGATSTCSEVTAAHAHADLKFQTIDLAFGRAFYLARSFSVHPFLGMEGAWIDQSSHFTYEGGDIPLGESFLVRFKNDFKGAGPLLGCDAHWHWGAGWSLLGSWSTALVCGFFETHQRQDQLSKEVVHYSNGFNVVSPQLCLQTAFAWDRNFNHQRSHVGLSLGFESQYWWQQNQMQVFTGSSLPSYRRERGDLALYGLVLKGRFDF